MATSIEDEHHTPDLAALQRVHFDIVVPHDPGLLGGVDPRDLDDEGFEQLAVSLGPPLDRLLALFEPRERK